MTLTVIGTIVQNEYFYILLMLFIFGDNLQYLLLLN